MPKRSKALRLHEWPRTLSIVRHKPTGRVCTVSYKCREYLSICWRGWHLLRVEPKDLSDLEPFSESGECDVGGAEWESVMGAVSASA